MRHPPIPERIRFGLGKILPDIRRGQIVNLREKEFQPGVPGFLGGGDEDAEIVSRHLLRYDTDVPQFRETGEAVPGIVRVEASRLTIESGLNRLRKERNQTGSWTGVKKINQTKLR